MTFNSDTMLNYYLSHKLKLMRKDKFNHLIKYFNRIEVRRLHFLFELYFVQVKVPFFFQSNSFNASKTEFSQSLDKLNTESKMTLVMDNLETQQSCFLVICDHTDAALFLTTGQRMSQFLFIVHEVRTEIQLESSIFLEIK